MTLSYSERRTAPETLLAETALLRARITSAGVHGLALDALSDDGGWLPVLHAPTAGLITAIAADGTRTPARFFAFDPVAINGEVRGVSLLGTLGTAPLTLLILLDTAGTCLRVQATVEGTPPGDTLEHAWPLSPVLADAPVRWPAKTRQAPTAFVQRDTCFAALVPEEPVMTVRARAGHAPALSAVSPLTPHGALATCSYHLCLDARALPGRGFQQVVRRLGASPAFSCMPRGVATPGAGSLPALPPLPGDAESWVPFAVEGSTSTLTALVREGMVRALLGDWSHLDDALYWLDRLILAPPVGATAAWLPVLLFEAFRLTGIREYAARGATLLSTLAPRVRRTVQAELSPNFGDIYVHMDVQEIVALQELDFLHASFTDDGVILDLLPCVPHRPLRLVLDGAESHYSLIANGHDYGALSAGQCLDGITL
jgi:hypothetical protein